MIQRLSLIVSYLRSVNDIIVDFWFRKQYGNHQRRDSSWTVSIEIKSELKTNIDSENRKKRCREQNGGNGSAGCLVGNLRLVPLTEQRKV